MLNQKTREIKLYPFRTCPCGVYTKVTHKQVLLFAFILNLVLIISTAHAFNFINPEGLGLDLVLTHQNQNEFNSSGFGSGFLIFLKYSNPSQTFLKFGSGFYTLTDNFLQMDQFQSTIFPSFEIQYGKSFGQNRFWHPNLYCGVNMYAAFDKLKENSSHVSISERFVQMCGIAGGGIEFQPNYLYSIHMTTDYRYVFYASEHNGRKYLVINIGFLFYQ